jgi:large subunit ribosomal protein L23
VNILLRPIVSEKSMREAAKNRYTFAVDKASNKAQIFQAVAAAFSVKPVSIKTITVRGKSRLAGKTRQMVKGEDWKKAIVELPTGQKIDLFDVTEGGKNA